MKLLFILLALVAFAFLAMTFLSRVMGGAVGRRGTLEVPKQLVAVPTRIADQIAELVRNGQKIEAIKLLRHETGCSLVEAKDTIEILSR